MSIFLPSRRSVLLTRKPGAISVNFDVDASAYIAAVEGPLGDNQTLETGVRTAINDFVVGCKADGTWSAIKASCILAGARTLSGALQPLAGAAPTNNNFISGDYNRKTGLIGNGTSKYLNSNRASNADPQNSFHLSIYASSPSSTGAKQYISASTGSNTSPWKTIAYDASLGTYFFSNTASNVVALNSGVSNIGLLGLSRSSSSLSTSRAGLTTRSASDASTGNANNNIYVFANSTGSGANLHSDARLAFYSIGESLDLALLDARVTALITAIGAAIP